MTCTIGTPINTNRRTKYRNRAAGHIYHNDKNRLNMGKRIKKNTERLVAKIMNNQAKGGWKDITNKIKTSIIGEQQTETITTMNIKTKFADMISAKAEGKTKTQYLLNNTTWKPGIRKAYMNKLTRMEASTIFKAQTRMLDIKNNYSGKHNDLTCRKCGEPTETQEHILDECSGSGSG